MFERWRVRSAPQSAVQAKVGEYAMRSIELFAGAGGLALGMARAGFRHEAVIEWDAKACETFRFNQRLAGEARDWPLFEADVRTIDFRGFSGVDLISGGPPCQPFSLGGKHRGFADSRDMFPEAVRAVRELQPKAFIFENVKGLLRDSFASYFEYIVLQLSHPALRRKRSESWEDHLTRLERHHTSGRVRPEYNVVFRLLNAADYGVPQRRERVFIVGFRADVGVDWAFPEPSHSEDALLQAKWISGEYWDRHGIGRRTRPKPSEAELARALKLEDRDLFGEARSPWQTVRDGLLGLPEPGPEVGSEINGHSFVSGARAYPGHTGSPIDEPAKTLKAGAHGVPGGENMLFRPDGTVRYFTTREAARLQTFPDEYEFPGTWTSAMRQLGNAVPVKLGEVVARSVATALKRSQF
jgi:DNA (cytosine-5)-methyltransferase 1